MQRLYVLVTVGNEEQQILGVFSSEIKAQTAQRELAAKQKKLLMCFGYFPCTLDTLIAK